MKATLTLLSMWALTALMLTGCGKTEEQPEPAVSGAETETDASSEADRLKETAEDQIGQMEAAADEIKDDIEAEVETVQEEVDAMAADASDDAFKTRVQEISNLIDAENYRNAMTQIKEALQLPDLSKAQKNTLQQLMDKVQKALAAQTTKQVEDKAGAALKGFGQ